MNPNLCPIKTDDPKNPGYIDPSTVSFLVGFATPLGVKFCERGVDEARFIPTKLTTTQVVAALEAARGYSEREKVLIDGLEHIRNRFAAPDMMLFAAIQKLLCLAGVPDAEP